MSATSYIVGRAHIRWIQFKHWFKPKIRWHRWSLERFVAYVLFGPVDCSKCGCRMRLCMTPGYFYEHYGTDWFFLCDCSHVVFRKW